MKRLWLLILLSITLTNCKDKSNLLDLPCENFFNEFKDDFEKSVKYKSHIVFLSDLQDKTSAYTNFVSLDLKLYYIELNLVQPICIDQNSKIIYLFDDESTSEYFVKNEYNCEGKILIERPFISEFKNKTVKGFRIKTKDGYLDYYINDKSKSELKKTASCYFDIANEKMKTL